jgi:hypothetical protein
MEPVVDSARDSTTAEIYRFFGSAEAQTSPIYQDWALGIANDPVILALIDELPPRKRQVNLVFAAARYAGAPVGAYVALREWLVAHWPAVRAVAETHATQTNEVGRCALLLPLLARLDGPIALLEVGTSAGLCLYPDRYSYDYGNRGRIDPPSGPSPAILKCELGGPVPVPRRVPDVVWRRGIDLNPLNVRDPHNVAWLESLIWPEHEDRRERLRAALSVVAADPPVIVQGDLNEKLPEVAGGAPEGATLVVYHTAVLAYLAEAERRHFVGTVSALPGHWIANEGVRVVPGVAERLADVRPEPADFVIAYDGEPVAFAQSHGRWLHWI